MTARNYAAELEAARAAGDWDAHTRIWEERRVASVEADEAAVKRNALLQVINNLKAAGHYFAAGSAAYESGRPREYGCHFGMRSELHNARTTFNRGWDAARDDAN